MNTRPSVRRTALPYDAAAGLRHLRRDPAMARVMGAVGALGLRVRQGGTHFAYLQRAIVSQQLSGRAAATIFGRYLDLFDGKPPEPAQVLSTRPRALRAAGLSRQKIAYLRDLAARVESGDVSLRNLARKDDEAIIADLCRVKGIGRWTVQMFLLFRLGRPDVLSELDLGIRKGVALCLGLDALPPPKEVVRLGERWAPYRSIASWYLWRATEVVVPG